MRYSHISLLTTSPLPSESALSPPTTCVLAFDCPQIMCVVTVVWECGYTQSAVHPNCPCAAPARTVRIHLRCGHCIYCPQLDVHPNDSFFGTRVHFTIASPYTVEATDSFGGLLTVGEFLFGHLFLRSRDNLHPFPSPANTFNQTWLSGRTDFPIQPVSGPDTLGISGVGNFDLSTDAADPETDLWPDFDGNFDYANNLNSLSTSVELPAFVPNQPTLDRPEGSEVLQVPGVIPLLEHENIESDPDFTEQYPRILCRNTKPNLENGHELLDEAREQIRLALLKLKKAKKEDARLQGLLESEDLSAGSVSDTKELDDLERKTEHRKEVILVCKSVLEHYREELKKSRKPETVPLGLVEVKEPLASLPTSPAKEDMLRSIRENFNVPWRYKELHGLLNLLLQKWVEGDIPLEPLAEFISQDAGEIKQSVERYVASLPREPPVVTMPIWLDPKPDEMTEG